jgi:hypothetical protein
MCADCSLHLPSTAALYELAALMYGWVNAVSEYACGQHSELQSGGRNLQATPALVLPAGCSYLRICTES